MSRINDLGQEKSSATSQLKDKAGQVQQNIREIGSQVKDVAREQYEHVRDQAQGYLDQGKEKAQEWEDGIERYVHDKPMQALLIAAGVGLLLGVLWKRG